MVGTERATKAIAAEAPGDHEEAKRLWFIVLGASFPSKYVYRRFELVPVAYQAQIPEPLTADDDDDWLVVRGHVRLGGNREWAFAGPYLTTSEAQRLGAWLASAGAGKIAPSPDVPPDRDLLNFTEPDIALSFATLSAGRASVRAHFSHESMPPWHPYHD